MAQLYIDEIRKRLEAMGVSMREFALRYHLNPGTFGMWMRGQRNPKLAAVEELAKIFHCPVEAISDFRPPEHARAVPPAMPESAGKCEGESVPRQRRMVPADFLPPTTPGGAPHEAVPLRRGQLREVPIMGFAQAAGYDPALEPIVDFVRNNSDDIAQFEFEDTEDGCFALRVDGDSMSPEYPHGTRLLVAGSEYPQRGDVVVACLRDGQVVVKDYWRKNNVITLSSENPNGRNFEWNCKEDPGFVLWMKPVLKVELDLRRRRWERSKLGMA